MIIHPLNFFPSSTFPDYETNDLVPNIGDNCTDKIECELYYEPDWDMVLKAEFTCDEIEAKQPCFGTFACVCDNKYKRISQSMPELSDAQKLELGLTNQVEDDDMPIWPIIVGASALVVIILIVVVVCIKRKQKRNAESTIKPMHG